MNVGDFYDAVHQIAPFDTAESWDNVGLLIGSRQLPVRRVMLALDLTGPVLDEAIAQHAQLVITHHPVIFQPLTVLSSQSIAYRAVAAGISVISAHTNLDVAQGGVNDVLAQRLGLRNIRPLQPQHKQPYYKVIVYSPTDSADAVYEAMSSAGAGRLGDYSHCGFLVQGEGRFLPGDGAQPAIGAVGTLESVKEVRLEMLCAPPDLQPVLAAMKTAHPYEEPAYDVIETHAVTHSLSLGRVGELTRPMTPEELARKTKERLGAAGVRYASGSGSITTVAVCGGSGGDLIAVARQMGAQALITGEVKHHQWLEAGEGGITLLDAGHFATENPVMDTLGHHLAQQLPEAEIILSQVSTDGVRHLA